MNRFVALAQKNCEHCFGTAKVFWRFTPEDNKLRTCSCVYRKVFQTCWDKYAEIQSNRFNGCGAVNLERNAGAEPGNAPIVYGNKLAEYCADFVLLAKRCLNRFEHRIFKRYYLDNIHYKLLMDDHRLSRRMIYYEVEKIQTKLGRYYCELKPFALYPVDEYFSTIKCYQVDYRKDFRGYMRQRQDKWVQEHMERVGRAHIYKDTPVVPPLAGDPGNPMKAKGTKPLTRAAGS